MHLYIFFLVSKEKKETISSKGVVSVHSFLLMGLFVRRGSSCPPSRVLLATSWAAQAALVVGSLPQCCEDPAIKQFLQGGRHGVTLSLFTRQATGPLPELSVCSSCHYRHFPREEESVSGKARHYKLVTSLRSGGKMLSVSLLPRDQSYRPFENGLLDLKAVT